MPTHTRIRMFNTKETYPNQTLNNDLCQAVRAGNTVYVRGQVGTGVVVSALAQPQWLMEIDVTAVIPDDWHAQEAP